MSLNIRTNEIDDTTIHWYVNNASFQWASSNGGEMIGTLSENTSFPVDNVLDLHPKKISKAGSNDVILSFSVNGSTDSVAVHNTNATSAIISFVDKTTGNTATDPATGEDIADILVDLQGATTYEQFITDKGRRDQRELFKTYPRIYAAHIINIYLIGPTDDSVITCGVVRVGESLDINKLLKGVTQTFKDYSDTRELNSGATYTLKRDMVRIFNLEFDQCAYGSEVESLKETFLALGPEPSSWLIADGNDEMWVVFARKNSELVNKFYSSPRTKSTFSLIEVL